MSAIFSEVSLTKVQGDHSGYANPPMHGSMDAAYILRPDPDVLQQTKRTAVVRDIFQQTCRLTLPIFSDLTLTSSNKRTAVV